MKEEMTIGSLAKEADVNIETIRFYERKGILKQPLKRGGFRYYGPEYIKRISFIKRSQELGFSLTECKELLDLSVQSEAKCDDVLVKTESKIKEISQKISDLRKMKKSLEELAGCCEQRSIPLSECPILDSMSIKKSRNCKGHKC